MANTLAPIFENAKAINPTLFGHGSMTHETEWMLMGVSTVIAIVAFVLAFVMFGSGKNVPEADGASGNFAYKLVYNKYYIDELYNSVIVSPIKAFGEYFYAVFEYLIIDFIVNLFGWAATYGGKAVRKLQTGIVSFYVLLMVFGVIILAVVSFTYQTQQ
jgi:NADH-quinone oxidoreductase subunit L